MTAILWRVARVTARTMQRVDLPAPPFEDEVVRIEPKRLTPVFQLDELCWNGACWVWRKAGKEGRGVFPKGALACWPPTRLLADVVFHRWQVFGTSSRLYPLALPPGKIGLSSQLTGLSPGAFSRVPNSKNLKIPNRYREKAPRLAGRMCQP